MTLQNLLNNIVKITRKPYEVVYSDFAKAKNAVKQPVQNLQAWGQVARSPQLRQEYGQKVIQPKFTSIGQSFEKQARQAQLPPPPLFSQTSVYQQKIKPTLEKVQIPYNPPFSSFLTTKRPQIGRVPIGKMATTMLEEAPEMPQIREKLGRKEPLTPQEKRIAMEQQMFAVADVALTGPKKGGVKIKAPEAKLPIRISGEQLGKPQKPLSFLKSAQELKGGIGTEVYAPTTLSKTLAGIPPSGKPSKAIIPQEKYAFNVNLERLNLTPKEKQVLTTTIDSVKPELVKIKGKTLSNKEVVEAAKRSDILTKVSTRDETKAAEAAILKARQRVVELDKDIGRLVEQGKTKQMETKMKDLIESLRVTSSTAADTGRKLQSFSIEAGDESIRTKLLKEIGKTEKDTNRIIKEAAKVDWENANSMTAFYRKFVKPSTMEILDEYRYNNMLSNPRTHLRNAFSNLIQTFVTRPATIAFTGKPVEATQYYKGALKSFPEAVEAFKQSFSGKAPIAKPDIARLGTQKLPRFMTIPTRAMEAADKFFSALIMGGEKARGATTEQAAKTAEYSLFRQGLFPEGQGKLLNAIDSMTNWTYKAPKAVRWFVPFIRTPMNFAKQWIEYSPAGLATLPGSAMKKEQLGKVLLGSTITAVAAKFALDGNTTWDAPIDPKQKELFYASGRKPFSVKVGDKWVSMMYAGPFAAAFALPAAMKYYQDESRSALTDSQLTKAVTAVGSMAKFLSGQTFLEGLNNFVKFASGDADYSLPSNLAFSAGQVIPMEGLVRWISTIVDPIYRKGSSFGEGLKKNLPFLSKTLEPYATPEGLPSTREPWNYITPYDITTNNPEYEPWLQQRTKELQQNAVINAIKKGTYKGDLDIPTQASTYQNLSLPSDTTTLGKLYTDNTKAIKSIQEKIEMLPYEITTDALGNVHPLSEIEQKIQMSQYQNKLKYSQDLIDKIRKEKPEAVFDIEIQTYASGGGASVEDRANWVAETLSKAASIDEFNSLVGKMLEGEVLTDAVVEVLQNAGIPVNKYISGGKIKTKGTTAKKTSAKKPPALPKMAKFSYKKTSVAKTKFNASRYQMKVSDLIPTRKRRPTITVAQLAKTKIKPMMGYSRT